MHSYANRKSEGKWAMNIKIESIRLKNFKAFKDVTVRDIPRMCVVVGAKALVQ
jgi:hypothetical protein